MSTVVSKEEAHRLVDQLPEDATWEDLMHGIYVREAIESGLEDSHSGRTRDVQEIRRKYRARRDSWGEASVAGG